MAYLTYIIDNYEDLPSAVAFLHPHQEGWWAAWHTDAPYHSNIISLSSVNLEFVQKVGYVNLRCAWKPGCSPSHNAHVTEDIWRDIFWDFTTPTASPMLSSIRASHFNTDGTNFNPPFPGKISAPCCAQFVVSKTQILRRRKVEYQKYRQWLLDTELSDAKSGRVMEFLWHIIFGKQAVFCPDPDVCYCEVYGRCTM